ncbi:DNA methyltransferase [uncultured Deinococcus sp.]|uniref:DNA methyltransferase n=1 Tax=uncultured Deinococcus sp. TaxID=158789 RepID=UPI0025CCE514|nr:DNA methyltransferase [uncultured Deinococcus sp.]
MKNLYFGDNLTVLREHIPDASVDLIYLDPPFNSQADYNVIFKDQTGKESGAQSLAFKDTWQWGGESEQALEDLMRGHGSLASFLTDLVGFLNHNSLSAYLAMMSVRLVELHRVLKPTGSLYLHCDPSASHYLKMIMDVIFGPQNFKNEIVWRGADAHNDAKKQFASVCDRLLFYAKDVQQSRFTPLHVPFPDKTLREWYLQLELPDGTTRRMTRDEVETQRIPPGARRFNTGDLRSPSPRPNLTYDYKGFKPHPNGWAVSRERMAELDASGRLIFPKSPDGRIMRKRYLDEATGPVMSDVWTDISQVRGHDRERLGYPTQKPVALLERILEASSVPGDVVLDPFCGCGTTISAAEKLGRQWIGIDVTHLSVSLIKARLKRDFDLIVGKDYQEIGTPRDLQAAQYFAESNPHQFQFWIVGEIGAQPFGAIGDSKQGKKGGDTGIDGQLFFRTPDGGKVERVIVSVKAGRNLNPAMVRDLRGTVEREKAAVGVLLLAHPPTKGMVQEAAQAGAYSWGGRTFPKLQILTVEQLLSGQQPLLPRGVVNVSYEQKAAKSLTGKGKKDRGADPLLLG